VCAQGVGAGQQQVILSACQRAQGLAPRIDYGQVVTGTVVSDLGDVWAFEGAVGQVITIEMRSEGSELDTYVTLYGPDGSRIGEDDDQWRWL